MSGNGIRCLAWVARARRPRRRQAPRRRHRRRAPHGRPRARRRRRRRRRDRRHGPGHLRPAEIPLDAPTRRSTSTPTFHGITYHGDAAGMGNPHLVLFVDDPATARVTQHGPHLEHDERFPNRTNVEFVAVPTAPTSSRMRVWERGVGETLSCGTGACAAAAVAHRRGLVGDAGHRARPRRRPRRRARRHDPPRRSGRARVRRRRRRAVSRASARDRDDAAGQARSRRRLTATEVDLGVVRQRALLVGTGHRHARRRGGRGSRSTSSRSSPTPRAPSPSSSMLQRRDRPDPATYIGSGKAEELRELAEALDVDVVVFDDELTPAQQRNLEKLFACDVVDRVALILDIFAQHAHSQEGMVQVELAQLRYRLPAPARPRARAEPAGRGGIGTRGSRRDAARGRPPAHPAPDHEARARPRAARPRPARRSARRAGAASSRPSRSSATRTPGSRRCSTGSPTPTCSSRTACSRPSIPPPGGCGSRGGEIVLRLRHRRLRAPPARTSSSRRSGRRSRRSSTPTCSSTSSTRRRADAEAQIDAVHAVLARSAPATVPELLVVNKTDARRSRRRRRPARRAPRRGRGVGPHRRGRRQARSTRSATGCARSRRSSSCACRTTAATCSPRCTATARCWSRCTTTAGPGCAPGCRRR